MSPVASSRQAEVLEALLGACAGAVVVFDLDDTLLSTTARHQRILAEFASDRSVLRRHPEAARLKGLPAASFSYLITDTVRAAGLDAPELLEDLEAFWFARFFRNDYLAEDEAVPGAPEYCRAAAERGAVVVYLTGRDEGMRGGTLASLERRGFPVPDGKRTRLMLKPRFETPDLAFKSEALERLRALGAVAGGFENEPAHVNLLADSFPEARMVLVETRHSGRPVLPYPRVARVRDFVLG